MKIRVTETAFAELNDIADYIAKDSPSAARAVVARIEEVFSRLEDFPYLAHPAEPSGIRIFPVRPFPYLVFYSIEQDEVYSQRPAWRASETRIDFVQSPKPFWKSSHFWSGSK